MVRFLDKLYTTKNVEPNVSKIKLKTISGIGMINVYFITLALSSRDIFDIYSSAVFKQRGMRKSDSIIIGIAESYDSALELVHTMISECVMTTGDASNIRQYFEQYVNEHLC